MRVVCAHIDAGWGAVAACRCTTWTVDRNERVAASGENWERLLFAEQYMAARNLQGRAQ